MAVFTTTKANKYDLFRITRGPVILLYCTLLVLLEVTCPTLPITPVFQSKNEVLKYYISTAAPTCATSEPTLIKKYSGS